jgi:hypothetical protein
MASRYRETNQVKCWDLLATVLSYGHTIPFLYKKDRQRYSLSEGGSGWGYRDDSSEEYLLDDIQFALFDEKVSKIQLHLSGLEDGPICSAWTFTFTKDGLVEAYSYYNDD